MGVDPSILGNVDAGEAQLVRFQGGFGNFSFPPRGLNLGRQERKGFGQGDLREDGTFASCASARIGFGRIRGTRS